MDGKKMKWLLTRPHGFAWSTGDWLNQLWLDTMPQKSPCSSGLNSQLCLIPEPPHPGAGIPAGAAGLSNLPLVFAAPRALDLGRHLGFGQRVEPLRVELLISDIAGRRQVGRLDALAASRHEQAGHGPRQN